MSEWRAAGDLIPACKRSGDDLFNVLAQQIALLNKLLSPICYQRLITRAAAIALGNGKARVMDLLPASRVQIPVHRGQSFRRIADSIPVIADSF